MIAVRAMVIVSALACSSCNSDANIVSAEVAAIPFDASTAVRQTDESAKKWPKFTDLTDSQIDALQQALNYSCAPADHKPEELDLRFSASVRTGESAFVWKASWFAFYDTRSKRMCKMSADLRDVLSTAFPYK